MDALEPLMVQIETFYIMVWVPENHDVPELFGDIDIQRGINYPLISGIEEYRLGCKSSTWMNPYPIGNPPHPHSQPPSYMHTTYTLPMKTT